MTNTVRLYTVANFVFKGLSIFNIVVAAVRLAIQWDKEERRIQYVSVAFLLVVEVTVAIIMVSISSYRVLFLDRLAEWQRKKEAGSTRLTIRLPIAGGDEQATNAKSTVQQDGSLSDLPILSTTHVQ